MPTAPAIELQADTRLSGFHVQSVTPVPELRAVAYRMVHEHSGARVLHLHTNDPENLFSVSFSTPPPDDTGMPHILEHAVLAGSERFPVREPFFEMIKMSMATFINAMTGPDCTYYPVASNVKKDLFNLAEVYFDAVFHPLLTEMTFRREGHHLAPADPGNPTGDLTVSGIVYNEMKGAYSDPEMLLYRAATHDLMPDTMYARDSGGDPEAVPDLTYEALRAFHAERYQPGNAFFCFYGNIPTVEYLAFLEDKLASFPSRPVPRTLSRQPRWAEPRSVIMTYPAGTDESLENKTYLGSFWLTGDALDADEVALLHVLGLLLLGNEAAPLRKAIIDSRLGADLVYSGAGTHGPEGTFRLVLKGSESDRSAALTDRILETLTGIANAGIPAERVVAAFRQATYRYAEILPMHPLHTLDRVLSAWICDRDPLTFLGMREKLADARARWEADPNVFCALITKHLVNNPHRLDVTLKPDPGMQGRMERRLRERMSALRATLSDDEVRRISAEAEELDRLNSEPNSPDALAALPQLNVSDLPGRVSAIATSVTELDGGALLCNDVFSNGVNYLALDFDLHGLPKDLWSYLPSYTDALRKCGAAGMDYTKMAERISASTGGIGCDLVFHTHMRDPGKSVWGFRVTLKALDEQLEDALAVLHDLLFSTDPSDQDRLYDILVQARAGYRTDLVHRGHSTARGHASRGMTEQGHLYELTGGLPQLVLVEDLAAHFEAKGERLISQIEATRDALLERGRLTASFTGSSRGVDTVQAALSSWMCEMRDRPAAEDVTGYRPFAAPPREGLAGPVQVAHCARVCPGIHFTDPAEPHLAAAMHLVRLDYILSEIRFKGNAYGAWFNHDPSDATLYFGSYRDPHIANTLRVFDGTRDYVRNTLWSQTDIDRAIIALTKDVQKPIRPGPATSAALGRYLAGQTTAARQARYEQLRSTTPENGKRALLDAIEAGFDRGAVCVVAGREKLEEANREMPDAPLEIRNILQ
jgi:hypothetical protein